MADNTSLPPGTGGDTVRTIDRSSVKTQVIQLDAGGEAGPESLATLNNPLPIAQSATNFFLSTGNSSTTQLTAGNIFLGAIESVLSQTQISILCTSDQPGLLTVWQYIDAGGVAVSETRQFQIFPGIGFSVAIKANGNYARVLYANNGLSTTTSFNLNLYYGTISETLQAISTTNARTGLPEALYSGGNTDDNEIPAFTAPTGMLAAEVYPKVFDGSYWQRQRGTLDGGVLVDNRSLLSLISLVLLELRTINSQLNQGLNIRDAVSQIRSDEAVNAGTEAVKTFN